MKQTFLTKTSLEGVAKVALVASAKSPKVTYSINAPGSGLSGLLFLFPGLALAAMGMEAAARSSTDVEHAREVGEVVDLGAIEREMTARFLVPLASCGRFQTVELQGDSGDELQAAKAGYDARISLTLSEIALERVAGDKLTLRVRVNGVMRALESGAILWNREEAVTSSQASAHPLEYYKSADNFSKELLAVLEEALRYLGYDFVYLE